ncbi:MAG: GNAT family N-acetyltransferase [Verrucomicrobiaceae bacterium]|nr:GNAT family N-acetyltransferase [Verrucomicrobiaceae bacterium]
MIARPFIQTPHGQRAVQIEFGRPSDADKLRSWRATKDSVSYAMADALEFGKLAGKRWRYYLKRNEAALSFDELKAGIDKVPQAEIGFLVIAKATWSPGPKMLGVAWCRRTWCNHIVLDFLAAHPSTLGPARGYAGIGTALLYYVAEIAGQIGAPLVWGEATALSAPFYRRVLNSNDILDHFFVRDTMVAKMREQLILRSNPKASAKP